MANLSLKGVNKIYLSGALALHDVNLELSDSEFVAVIGGPKSGKTTLLRVIAGLDEVTDGTVEIDGKDVTEADPKDRDVAMIFQGNTLYPAMTVFENLAFGLKMRKAPQVVIEQRVKAVAEILGLNDVLYRKPKALTSEQKQKTVLGRAIAREPKLYLLDDPISGLDGELKAQMRNVIVNLQARMNGTFVYATKNVNEALSMATRVIVLKDGFVQQIDAPSNLYDYPSNAYVALLIGSPNINFINNVTLCEEEGEIKAVFNGGKITLPEEIKARFTDISEYIGSGKQIILGLRPEDMSVTDNEPLFKAKVTASEEIDGRGYIDCAVNGSLSFVTEGKANKGEEIALSADLTRLYVFDAATRFNLLSRDGGYIKTAFAEADRQPLSYEEEERIKGGFKKPVTGKKKK